jgi:hypothetical protein
MEKKLADRLANFGSSGFLKVGYRSTAVAAQPKRRAGTATPEATRSARTTKKAAS